MAASIHVSGPAACVRRPEPVAFPRGSLSVRALRPLSSDLLQANVTSFLPRSLPKALHDTSGVLSWHTAGSSRAWNPREVLVLPCAADATKGEGARRRAGARAQAQTAAGPWGETVAIVGGTGFIGRALVARLLKDGSTVKVLTRSEAKARTIFTGKEGSGSLALVEPPQWSAAIVGASAVVNLAGTPISTRWSPTVKQDIVKSRVDTTNKIVAAILAAPADLRPTVFVSSSAVGFYGVSETATYDESSSSGTDFLAKLCLQWEDAARKVEAGGVRLVIIRNGIVLEKEGGALASMIPIFQAFAGGPLGSGAQWMSWIHRDDIVDLFIQAIRDPNFEGVVNGSAPNPVRVSELCDQLGSTLGRPSWLPVPEFALKALLGEGASVVLDGQRVLPKRTEQLGYKFKYRYIRDALAAIFK